MGEQRYCQSLFGDLKTKLNDLNAEFQALVTKITDFVDKNHGIWVKKIPQNNVLRDTILA